MKLTWLPFVHRANEWQNVKMHCIISLVQIKISFASSDNNLIIHSLHGFLHKLYFWNVHQMWLKSQSNAWYLSVWIAWNALKQCIILFKIRKFQKVKVKVKHLPCKFPVVEYELSWHQRYSPFLQQIFSWMNASFI